MDANNNNNIIIIVVLHKIKQFHKSVNVCVQKININNVIKKPVDFSY